MMNIKIMTPDGVWIEPREPWIQRNHVDGPLLCQSDGGLHWLTLWERLLLALDLTNAVELDRKYTGIPYAGL